MNKIMVALNIVIIIIIIVAIINQYELPGHHNVLGDRVEALRTRIAEVNLAGIKSDGWIEALRRDVWRLNAGHGFDNTEAQK